MTDNCGAVINQTIANTQVADTTNQIGGSNPFNFIINPTTGAPMNLFSSGGRAILKSYIKCYKNGGTYDEKGDDEDEEEDKLDEEANVEMKQFCKEKVLPFEEGELSTDVMEIFKDLEDGETPQTWCTNQYRDLEFDVDIDFETKTVVGTKSNGENCYIDYQHYENNDEENNQNMKAQCCGENFNPTNDTCTVEESLEEDCCRSGDKSRELSYV